MKYPRCVLPTDSESMSSLHADPDEREIIMLGEKRHSLLSSLSLFAFFIERALGH